jgi:hypothetical protein
MAGEGTQLRIGAQRIRRKVQQPGRHDAAMPPYLRNRGDVEVILVTLGIAQWGRLGVDRALTLAGVGVLQDVEPSAYASIRPYSIAL